MLYSRSEIVDMCYEIGGQEASLFLSLIWHLSRGDPNCDSHTGRYGLMQVPLDQAGGHTERELAEARTNIEAGARLLRSQGLLAFLGRDFASQYHSIMGLAEFLERTPRV
jgi:soluble lytic murein transglycosylase-like protein